VTTDSAQGPVLRPVSDPPPGLSWNARVRNDVPSWARRRVMNGAEEPDLTGLPAIPFEALDEESDGASPTILQAAREKRERPDARTDSPVRAQPAFLVGRLCELATDRFEVAHIVYELGGSLWKPTRASFRAPKGNSSANGAVRREIPLGLQVSRRAVPQ